MAAIQKKLIHFNLLSDFQARLENNDILETSIVFIKDAKLIWTHGEYYCAGSDSSTGSNQYSCDSITIETIESTSQLSNNDLIAIVASSITHRIICVPYNSKKRGYGIVTSSKLTDFSLSFTVQAGPTLNYTVDINTTSGKITNVKKTNLENTVTSIYYRSGIGLYFDRHDEDDFIAFGTDEIRSDVYENINGASGLEIKHIYDGKPNIYVQPDEDHYIPYRSDIGRWNSAYNYYRANQTSIKSYIIPQGVTEYVTSDMYRGLDVVTNMYDSANKMVLADIELVDEIGGCKVKVVFPSVTTETFRLVVFGYRIEPTDPDSYMYATSGNNAIGIGEFEEI